MANKGPGYNSPGLVRLIGYDQEIAGLRAELAGVQIERDEAQRDLAAALRRLAQGEMAGR
jgi:hypothetical protein